MKKIFIFFIFLTSSALAENSNNIVQKLKNIDNLSFNFEQNINGKIEKGNCIIEYPKKIYCKYNLKNEKILVSNGRSLVVKTLDSYYLYPIEKTPLNFILNKNFLLKKIINLNKFFFNLLFLEIELI